jgi:hypothetical protein
MYFLKIYYIHIEDGNTYDTWINLGQVPRASLQKPQQYKTKQMTQFNSPYSGIKSKFIIASRNASQDYFHKTYPHLPHIYNFNNYLYIIIITVYVSYIHKIDHKNSFPHLKYKGSVDGELKCLNYNSPTVLQHT